jgi:hypothetical protein
MRPGTRQKELGVLGSSHAKLYGAYCTQCFLAESRKLFGAILLAESN